MRNGKSVLLAALTLLAAVVAGTQTQTGRLMGTVDTVTSAQITVRPDKGQLQTVLLDTATRVQRVAPGARDLASAETISAAGLAPGDRVLVRGAATAAGFQAVSIIVMSGQDIQRKNDQERMEWTRRGVSGLVRSVDTAKGEITVGFRSFEGPKEIVVAAGPATSFKRYAPDSIRFADAKDSLLQEVRAGDQMRALGEKNGDGTRLTAERVVFGTFRTVAGSVTAVNAEAGEIRIRDLGTGKALLVRVRPDSQLKKMPQFPGGGPPPGMGMRGGPPGGGPPGGGPPRGGAPDLSMMIERMPPAAIQDFTPGETMLVSSTAGAKPNELTAIVVLGGADMLLARFSASQQGSSGTQTQGPSMMGAGFGGGLDSMMGGFPIIP